MKGFYMENPAGLPSGDIESMIMRSVEGETLKKVLLIPPDITRASSGAGMLTAMYYKLLTSRGVQVDILPAIGTHEQMTRAQQLEFFGDGIPAGCFLEHDWRGGIVQLGVVPGEFVRDVSEGIMTEPIIAETSKILCGKSYDLMLSIGQVVPHEVVGMANYTKNILVGCGGSSMINSSHMLGAFYGLERIMGKDFSPVRKVFDYAEEHFLQSLPIRYVLTVTVPAGEDVSILGLYIGRDRSLFERAVALSQARNITSVSEPVKTCVVRLDEREFRSTWIGNKAVYRTRMMLADGARLIILAPGIDKFGEDAENDRLIRKFGYIGREGILRLAREESELQANLSVAAHLIHGSSDGRFEIIYAVKRLTREEVEGVGFTYADYDELSQRYSGLSQGFNTLNNGERVYYIGNPAVGLWQQTEIEN